jgi:hypothetical protein
MYTAIISLNSINQLIYLMAKCGVLFEVRTGFLNKMKTNFGFKGLKVCMCIPACYVLKHKTVHTIRPEADTATSIYRHPRTAPMKASEQKCPL